MSLQLHVLRQQSWKGHSSTISPASEHKTETEGIAYNQDVDQNPGFVKLRGKKKGLVYSALNPAVSFKPLWLPKVELGMKRSAEAQGKAAHLKTMATALTSRQSVRGGEAMKAGGASELQGMGAPGPGGAALGCGQPRMLIAPPNEERRHRQDVLGVHLAWPLQGT